MSARRHVRAVVSRQKRSVDRLFDPPVAHAEPSVAAPMAATAAGGHHINRVSVVGPTPETLEPERQESTALAHTIQQASASEAIQRQAVATPPGSGGFDPRCLEILGRILAFLYGGPTNTIGSVGVWGPPVRGVMERIAQLLVDPKHLYIHHRTLAQAHPLYGSWEGHQLALEGEQRALRHALDEWRTHCGGPDNGGSAPAEAAAAVRVATAWATRPVPDRPQHAAAAAAEPERRYTITLRHAGGANLTHGQAIAAITEELRWDANRVDQLSGEHVLVKQNRDEHFIVGWMSDVAGGVDMPPLTIWDDPRAKLAAARAAAGAGNVDGALTSLVEYEKALASARDRYFKYKEGTISGAESVELGAEVVAVAAAVVFVAAGGWLLLAPGATAGATVGAGAAAGTAATTATAAGTGATAAGTTTTVTVIAASDSVAAANVLRVALAASAEVTVPAELLTAAGEAAVWTAEDVMFMSMP